MVKTEKQKILGDRSQKINPSLRLRFFYSICCFSEKKNEKIDVFQHLTRLHSVIFQHFELNVGYLCSCNFEKKDSVHQMLCF